MILSKSILAGIVIGAVLGSPASIRAAERESTETMPDDAVVARARKLDTEEALSALKRMSDFLAGHERFAWEGEIGWDTPQANGQRLEFGQPTSLGMFRNDDAVMPDGYKDADGPIDLEGSLAALALGGNAQKEARRYLDAEPGWELSLSTEEIATLRALEPPAGGEVAAVEGALRSIFADRVRSYSERGLVGIAPFDRGDGTTSSVGSDLESGSSTRPSSWAPARPSRRWCPSLRARSCSTLTTASWIAGAGPDSPPVQSAGWARRSSKGSCPRWPRRWGCARGAPAEASGRRLS